MKTEYELIKSVLSDKNIAEKFKIEERKKMGVCSVCPLKTKCFSCGVWHWWEVEK